MTCIHAVYIMQPIATYKEAQNKIQFSSSDFKVDIQHFHPESHDSGELSKLARCNTLYNVIS